MSGPASPLALLRFGDFEADLRANRLRKHGIRLKLFKQSFDVLVILLEHAGEVVTREELRCRLWPDITVDFENNLNTGVARLREALGDTARQPRFIETIPRCGYRFLAPVSAASKPRLLVLPFADRGGDPTQEYLCDAVTEELISELANLAPDRLAVIAHTTAMRYKRFASTVAKIAQELTLDYVVEGSILRSGERVTANIQLIRAADETHMWAGRYDARMGETFALENAAARAISEQLGVSAGPAAVPASIDPITYDLYCRGRYHLFRGTPDHIAQAKDCLEQAVARSPEFALAYDSLAELYWYSGFLGFVPPRQSCSSGIYYAVRALEIDNTLGETHALLGLYRKGLSFDWAEMDREMVLARQLSPASPLVRMRYAISLLSRGRVQEAAAELDCALELDPHSPLARTWLVVMLWLARRYQEASDQARVLSEIDPEGYLSHFAAGFCHREQHRFDEAIAAHSRSVEISGGSPLMMGWLGLALAQGDRRDEARAVLNRLHQIAERAYVPPTSFAWIHLGLGETDEAFVWMERAIEGRDPMMTPIRTYPFFDPLRSDSRFLRLLEKMNLAPE